MSYEPVSKFYTPADLDKVWKMQARADALQSVMTLFASDRGDPEISDVNILLTNFTEWILNGALLPEDA